MKSSLSGSPESHLDEMDVRNDISTRLSLQLSNWWSVSVYSYFLSLLNEIQLLLILVWMVITSRGLAQCKTLGSTHFKVSILKCFDKLIFTFMQFKNRELLK